MLILWDWLYSYVFGERQEDKEVTRSEFYFRRADNNKTKQNRRNWEASQKITTIVKPRGNL